MVIIYGPKCFALSINPDPKWLDALKLPANATIAVALAVSVLFTLADAGVLDLGPLGAYAEPVLLIIAVVFWILTLVKLGDYLLVPYRERRRQKTLSIRRAVRRREEQERREAREKAILAHLDHLSLEEISYVADCLRNGTPTFYTWVNSPAVAMLLGKQLVWTPGTTHDQDKYPFGFYAFVWEVLLTRKDEFLAKDEAQRRR